MATPGADFWDQVMPLKIRYLSYSAFNHEVVTEARLSRTQAANALLNTRRTLAGYNRITRHRYCCCTDKVEHEPFLSTSSRNNKTYIMLSFVTRCPLGTEIAGSQH
jgi:hypothetical protein